MKHIIKTITVIVITFLCSFNFLKAEDVNVSKIWSNGKYCAFTSLIKYKGNFYCAFREAESHIFDSDGVARGVIRVIRSKDGNTWESFDLISKDEYDLRDPKLSITPKGKLMLLIGGSVYKNKKLEAAYTQISFLGDDNKFSAPVRAEIDYNLLGKRNWLWRLTWHKNKGYVINYSFSKGEKDVQLYLMQTSDGLKYDIVSTIDIKDFPNESTIRFGKKDEIFVMVRRDAGDKKGYLCSSKPPYKEWNFNKMDTYLGGPDFLFLNNDNFILATRAADAQNKPKTIVFLGDKDGKTKQMSILPSGGDNSYPSILIEGKEVWISYYSQHENSKCEIFLAKYPLKMIKKALK